MNQILLFNVCCYVTVSVVNCYSKRLRGRLKGQAVNMDSSFQIARTLSSSSSTGGLAADIQPLPPTNGKLPSKLTLHSSSCSKEAQPPAAFLQEASSDLDQAMKHLQAETQSAEKQVQKSMELLWQRMMEMLEQRTNEIRGQLTALQEELDTTKDKLSRTSQQEAALVQQNAKMSMEAVTEEKRRKTLEASLAEARAQLVAREGELGGAQRELKGLQETSRKEVEGLQADVKEKSKVLKEYQDKISKLTDKMKELTKCLSVEKETSEKSHKTASEQVSQQTSENRKMALEISKLKSQLGTSVSALTASKEEVRRLETELAKMKQNSEAAIVTLQGQHSVTVKTLERRISELEKELATLRSNHQSEIAQLVQELNEMKTFMAQQGNNDDGLDARIRFLQHQNREEKKRLEIGKKPQKF